MKNLDLNKYGVQEMNAGEMSDTNGGSLLGWVSILVTVVCLILTNVFND